MQKPFLLPSMSWQIQSYTPFSDRIFVFLLGHWPWFHLLYASFSILSFVQSYWFNYVDLLLHLFDFLHLEGDHFWTSRTKILQNQSVLLEPLLSRIVYYGILPSRHLNMKKSEHQGYGPIFWLCSFFKDSWTPYSHGHCKKKTAPEPHNLTNFSFPASMKSLQNIYSHQYI